MYRTNSSSCSSLLSVAAWVHITHTNFLTSCYSSDLYKRLSVENITRLCITQPAQQHKWYQQLSIFRVNERYLSLGDDSGVTGLYFRLSVWWIIISSVWFSSQTDLASRLLTCLWFIHQSHSLGRAASSRPQNAKVRGKYASHDTARVLFHACAHTHIRSVGQYNPPI